MKSLVSIIVPVFNAEKYLVRCVDSLIGQTYEHVEIILVDDGSIDSGPILCDEYAQKDKRIKVIHCVNGGPSIARNTGLNLATGPYVMFVDSDDYIAKKCVEISVRIARETSADIVEFGHKYIYPASRKEQKTPRRNPLPQKDIVLSGTDAFVDLLTVHEHTKHAVWGKLYKLAPFRKYKISFPEHTLHEDGFVSYKLYYFANKIVCTDAKLYYYDKTNTSSITSVDFSKKHLEVFRQVSEMRAFNESYKIGLEREIEHFNASVCLEFFQRVYESRELKREKNDILKKFRKTVIDNVKMSYLPSRQRVGAIMLHLGCKPYIVYIAIKNTIKRIIRGAR